MKRLTKYIILAGLLSFTFACSGQDDDSTKVEVNQKITKDKSDTLKPMVTFVELGSVNCIPCKKMQPVMKAIEEKYGDQIEVIFYDVWKPEQRKYAEEYGIRLIPTQVFLDKDGKELFRHEGFFPEGEIDQFLQKQGLKPNEKV
jgi:thioredoxin 1